MRFHGIAQGEVVAARRVAREAGVEEHRFVSLPQLMELSDIGPRDSMRGLPRTYIPMKNAVYYSLAAGYAEETSAARIVGGHNRDDLEVFEDTSDEFFGHLQSALRAGSSRLRRAGLVVWRPLRGMTKGEVVSLAHELRVPMERTWSCHESGARHCWRCEGCLERVRSFEEAGVPDPLRQESSKNV